MDASRSHRRLAWWPALLAILLFLPSLRGDFVYDDRALLSLNPRMQQWEVVGDGFTTPFWQLVDPDRDASGFYRPLAVLSFASLWQLGGGEPLAYRAFALLLHGAAAALLCLLALRLGATAGQALLAGLLFAALGAHVEAVSWISAIPDLQATVLVLAALLAFVGGRAWLGAGALLLAILTKESALSLWLALLLLAAWRQRGAVLPLVACAAVLYGLRAMAFGDAAAGFDRATTRHGLGAMDQLMLSLSLVGRYLAHLLWPWPQPIFEVLRLDLDWRSPARWGWAAGAVVVGLACLRGLWKSRAAAPSSRLPWLGLGFVLLTLLPVLDTTALGQYPFEQRFLYLPSLGFAVALAWLLVQSRWGPAGLAVGGLLLVGNAWSSWQGQKNWQDEESLFTWAREASPDAMTGHIEYGRLQLELAQASMDPMTRRMHAERAFIAYQRSLEVDPDQVLVTSVEREKGNLGQADALYLEGDFAAAEEIYRRIAEHYRFSPLGYLGLGNCRAQEGLRHLAEGYQTLADAAFEEALVAFDTALAQKPGLQNALTGKANALAQLGRPLEAYGPALAAYEQRPDDLNALMLLLSLNVAMNRLDEAIGLLQAFQQRYPDHPRGMDVVQTLDGLRQMQEQQQ